MPKLSDRFVYRSIRNDSISFERAHLSGPAPWIIMLFSYLLIAAFIRPVCCTRLHQWMWRIAQNSTVCANDMSFTAWTRWPHGKQSWCVSLETKNSQIGLNSFIICAPAGSYFSLSRAIVFFFFARSSTFVLFQPSLSLAKCKHNYALFPLFFSSLLCWFATSTTGTTLRIKKQTLSFADTVYLHVSM